MNSARALVISIDAITKADLLAAAKYPTFASLLERCALAGQVEAAFPSLTYPCHVTMATGCWPMHTGILNNERFLPETLKRPWYFYTRQIRCPTIFDAAARAGVSTGCVMWPCMGGGPIDTLVPEIWGDDPNGAFLDPFLSAGTADFIREIWPEVGAIPRGFAQPMFDRFVTAISCEMIRKRQPRLMYVHICQVDNAKHYAGIHAPQVETALQNTDALLKQLFDALKSAGLYDATNIILCSDHGQLPVDRVSFPNRLLRALGMLNADDRGRISGRIQLQSACLSALVYAESEAWAQRAWELFSEPENRCALGIERLIDRDTARRTLHLDGGFAFALTGLPGVYFDNRMDEGPLMCSVQESGLKYRANHGHDPRLGDKPFFLISGPAANAGARLSESIQLVDEPVTVARLMGFDMPGTDGHALDAMLKL